MSDHKKDAVDKYLEQIKVLSALATALLVSPNLIVAIKKLNATGENLVFEATEKGFLLAANISFLVTIVMTYFIYSSIVGFVDEGKYDLYRTATVVFSIIQLLALLAGCTFLGLFFYRIA